MFFFADADAETDEDDADADDDAVDDDAVDDDDDDDTVDKQSLIFTTDCAPGISAPPWVLSCHITYPLTSGHNHKYKEILVRNMKTFLNKYEEYLKTNILNLFMSYHPSTHLWTQSQIQRNICRKYENISKYQEYLETKKKNCHIM